MKFTELHKKRISKALTGLKRNKPAWNKSKKMPDDQRLKLKKPKTKEAIANRLKSVLARGSYKGIKNPAWKGGVSKKEGYNAWKCRRRYNRKRGAFGGHTLGEWETLKVQYDYKCPCCNRVEPAVKLTEDHIIPLSKGGSDNIENIQPLCLPCNVRKNTNSIKYDKQ